MGFNQCSGSAVLQQSRSSQVHYVSVLMLMLFCCVHPTFPCPKSCFCAPHSKTVNCANKGLTSIPEGIPYDTIELVLDQNSFENPVLTRRNFTNLVKLQALYMNRCGIETLAANTFADLTNLQWLGIGYNKITFIADNTFSGLNLKHLFINDNKGIQLSEGAFEGMTTQGLYMHNSGMSKLSVNVMSPLNGTLRTLWLYQNNFESFSEEWLYLFNTLGHLRLGGNAFHCNCEIGWLHKFFKKHSSVFSGGDLPICATPALVRGKQFNNLTADDFRCDLPTFRNVDAVFEREMGKLTCQARGDPTPTLYWIRPDGTTEIYSPAREDTEQTVGILYMTNVKLTDSARYKCVASNPAGNVTFSLNVVWPATPPPPPVLPMLPRTTPKSFHHPKSNVIVADRATPRPSGSWQFRDQAVKAEKKPYDWGINKPEKKQFDKMEDDEVKTMKDVDVRFTILDLVGAVVGTFVITLLLSIIGANLYIRHKERLAEDHYSVPDCKPPLAPARLYIMGEDGENRIRMLNHHGRPECPT
ncbi:leucine-rich repeat and fibronectin type III domain-containing protein 1-like protein [Babylonia areolata]|uniref:leucine-rich repeat and fibronectin type III domain-containing protein 1-like protein n=1 Tax=Babylonia areolata TaxID=304850 RepID=UPI003FD635B0